MNVTIKQWELSRINYRKKKQKYNLKKISELWKSHERPNIHINIVHRREESGEEKYLKK